MSTPANAINVSGSGAVSFNGTAFTGSTLSLANGGTNATSMATSTGIVKYDGTRLVTSSAAKIDSSNRQTNASQPAFLAYLNASVSNVTGDSTDYTVAFNATLYDQNSNFNTGTFTFTAPVTGVYNFSTVLLAQAIIAASTVTVKLTTTANTFLYGNTGGSVAGNEPYAVSWMVQMSATDTATVHIIVSGGAKTVGLFGDVGTYRTMFTGYLVC